MSILPETRLDPRKEQETAGGKEENNKGQNRSHTIFAPFHGS